MLERLKYKNHLGEVIDFGRSGIFVSSNDLHDYNWTVTSKNDKISAFKRSVATRTLPVVIFCPTAEAGVAARNRLLEVAEKDVLAKKPGRIIVGDYYFSCYVTGSKKANYLRTRRRMEAKLTLVSDAPYWVRESTHSFRKAGSEDPGFGYPFDYAFDFTSGVRSVALVNTSFTASNFRLIFFGPCKDPVVYVGGHPYGVNCTLAVGEYATVDSASKTITKTAPDGTTTNLFNLRRRDAYIFQPIPPGQSAVSWDDDLGVDIILLDERSEPKWT